MFNIHRRILYILLTILFLINLLSCIFSIISLSNRNVSEKWNKFVSVLVFINLFTTLGLLFYFIYKSTFSHHSTSKIIINPSSSRDDVTPTNGYKKSFSGLKEFFESFNSKIKVRNPKGDYVVAYRVNNGLYIDSLGNFYRSGYNGEDRIERDLVYIKKNLFTEEGVDQILKLNMKNLINIDLNGIKDIYQIKE